jgi:DNA-binding NarL/FixJ family response regulator
MPFSPGPCDHQLMARTVLIVDDHPPFRALARTLQLEGFEVVGEAGDALSALDAVRRLRPSVVLLDVQLPDLDGFEVARRLSEAGDPPAIVLVSSRDSSAYRRRLADSPARGFIPKSYLSGATVAAESVTYTSSVAATLGDIASRHIAISRTAAGCGRTHGSPGRRRLRTRTSCSRRP